MKKIVFDAANGEIMPDLWDHMIVEFDKIKQLNQLTLQIHSIG